MIKNWKKSLLSGCLGVIVPFSFSANAQGQANTDIQDKALSKQRKVESDLLADNVNIGFKELAVDSILLQMALNKENLLYLADELYDESWNTTYVKAYSEMNIPETYTIDVSGFVMPIEGRITSHYGPRRRRFHYGTDIKVHTGDTIYAAFDGKVRVKRYERRGYGYYLVLRHPNGLETVYGHLSSFLVDQDQVVKAGEPIGLGGNTGRSTGPHLHFEFRLLGQSINPEEIIDFNDFCAKDDLYVFNKSTSGKHYRRSSSSKSSSASKYTAAGDDKIKYYKIKEGDTLGAIARRHKTTVSKLCKLNKIKSTTVLRVGRSIRIV